MIKVSVMYPNSDELVFDKEYYLNTHVPLVSKLLGDSLKNAQVDFGLAGGVPGEAAMYAVMTHMSFESVEAFQAIFAPNSVEILSDIANFTNCQPQLQISEVQI